MIGQSLSLAIGLVLIAVPCLAESEMADSQRLPAEFACDRVDVVPRTVDGKSVRFFTDTGGGTWIAAEAAARLGLESTKHEMGDEVRTTVGFPAFAPDAAIPGVDPEFDTRAPDFHGRLFALDKTPSFLQAEGMLGQEWFGGRVWTFDYGVRTLMVGGPGAAAGQHTVELGFKIAKAGRRATNFPSIRAKIDGEELPFLLDTGATITPSAPAAAAIGLPGAANGCATSFITTSVYERWRTAHPDWLVIESADTVVKNEPMIRVPAVEIAGHTVGPVWFTRRADGNFHDYMSSMMDTKVEGALGGSLLRYFRLTIDYPAARARFERLNAEP